MEVQGKMQELSRGLRQVSYRMQLNDREQRKCKITLQELGALPATTPMYRAAGAAPRLLMPPFSDTDTRSPGRTYGLCSRLSCTHHSDSFCPPRRR